MFRVVIPARYGSARLPGKPLARPLEGPDAKTLLALVHDIALASGAAQTVVATDDERVMEQAARLGATARMTSLTHPSGTDRIAEVAMESGWADEDVVVNLPVDSPLTPPELPAQVAGLLAAHPEAAVATLATRILGIRDLMDPNVVKVVCDRTGRALYFSRAPIPWGRDSAPAGIVSQRGFHGARRHIGLYAYRVSALRRLSMLPPTPLELLEKLEQLRALEYGLEIRVADASAQTGPDVNTPEDLARVALLMKPPAPPALQETRP